MSPFPTSPIPVIELQAAVAGARCQRDAAGWVCPHRQFSFGSIAPDSCGIITCPLHGLQVDAATGVAIAAGVR